MKPKIKKFNLQNEFYFQEKCHIMELSNSEDDPQLSIARARVEPGVTTRLHRLRETIERYYIIEGKGRVEIGERPPENVCPGDVVIIPPLCSQRITNIGHEDLVFLAVCTPRFEIDVYDDIELNPSKMEKSNEAEKF